MDVIIKNRSLSYIHLLTAYHQDQHPDCDMGKGWSKIAILWVRFFLNESTTYFYAVFKTKIMKHLNSIPLSPRVAIRQPNDRPNKLLYFKTFKWYDNGILAR